MAGWAREIRIDQSGRDRYLAAPSLPDSHFVRPTLFE